MVLTGYQAHGTRGASLRDGADSVRIHGHDVPVNAEVVQLGHFSVHADRDGVRAWFSSATVRPKRVVLIHGEHTVREAPGPLLKEEFGVAVLAPQYEETLSL